MSVAVTDSSRTSHFLQAHEEEKARTATKKKTPGIITIIIIIRSKHDAVKKLNDNTYKKY
jgi:hypothetical protein